MAHLSRPFDDLIFEVTIWAPTKASHKRNWWNHTWRNSGCAHPWPTISQGLRWKQLVDNDFGDHPHDGAILGSTRYGNIWKFLKNGELSKFRSCSFLCGWKILSNRVENLFITDHEMFVTWRFFCYYFFHEIWWTICCPIGYFPQFPTAMKEIAVITPRTSIILLEWHRT